MRRREFIRLLGGAAVVAPPAYAQQSDRVKRIGVLVGAATEHDPESEARIAAFRRGLEELGWVDGRNIRIDYRFAGGDADRNPDLRSGVSEVGSGFVANSSLVVAELKRNTGTIPIVFAVVTDPANQGFVMSLTHPGAILQASPSSSSRLPENGSGC